MNANGAGSRTPECDLVMKGGITSGVIYPRLVTELARVYRLRSIGGTSAGAIAAAAAAAAQLGVTSGANPQAFEQLDRLPEDLGKAAPGGRGSMLLSLFQPSQPLQGHFSVLLSVLDAKTKSSRISGGALALISNFPLGAFLGFLPGLILFGQSWGLGWLLALVLLPIGTVLGAAIAAILAIGRELPRNYFGVCSGMTAAGSAAPALTPWLHEYLNALCGKKSGEPLTFGELWAGRLRETGQGAPAPPEDGQRVIHLEMMTTAVNLGRPYRVPFESRDIYFVKEEMETLFPPPVVEWLVTHARPSGTAAGLTTTGRTFCALPEPEDFPVIVAVRLSLSFPILLSALPLYTIDRTLNANKVKATQATRIYFSDGGICSNFPVHFFDSLLPTRPTFGVNLRKFHPEHPHERVWLPEAVRNDQGLKNHYPPLSDEPRLGSVIGFLSAIVNTMQSWRDHMQLAMPGFRDRIAHVSHSDTEGGINLNMPPEVLQTLAASGSAAALKLIEAFATEDAPGWHNHQRIRARTLLALLQRQLQSLAKALATVRERPYDEVVSDPEPPSYPFESTADIENARWLLNELQRIANELKERNAKLAEGAPRPAPDLRVLPRV